MEWLTVKWMHWTWPSGLFFLGIVLMLVILTIWDMISPGYARRGLLPIATTRGDRVFMGLLAIGIIFLFWLKFLSTTALWALFPVGGVVLVLILVFF